MNDDLFAGTLHEVQFADLTAMAMTVAKLASGYGSGWEFKSAMSTVWFWSSINLFV